MPSVHWINIFTGRNAKVQARSSTLRLLGAMIALPVLFAFARAQESVPASRLQLLQHGINIGRFKPDGSLDNPNIANCTKAGDPGSCTYNVLAIKTVGADHVRILLEPGSLLAAAQETFNQQSPSLQALDRLVDQLVNEKPKSLGVILALSFDDDPRLQNKLTNPDFQIQLGNLWKNLASHYSGAKFSESVFFEVLNEPGLYDPFNNDNELDEWAPIQAKLVKDIRSGAPRNTILVVGAQKSDINGLLALPPIFDDKNVIYVFHYYEPYSFTSQGENWGNTSYMHSLDKVPYPYAAAPAKAAADLVKTSLIDKRNVWHDMESSTKDNIEIDLEIVEEWLNRNGAHVICDEFGVQRRHPDPDNPSRQVGAEPDDRERWIHDVKELLEHHHIGWTFWDYTSASFGLLPDNGTGESVAKALGFQIPATQ